jgi:glutaredoxin 3
MSNILIYSTSYCPYCDKAKKLLQKKNLSYKEIDVTNNDQMRVELIEKSNGRKTVPQIFINDYHVGGCDDLYALEAEGKLDDLINKKQIKNQ